MQVHVQGKKEEGEESRADPTNFIKKSKKFHEENQQISLINPTNLQGKNEEGEESRADRCLPVRWRGIDLVKQKGRPEWF